MNKISSLIVAFKKYVSRTDGDSIIKDSGAMKIGGQDDRDMKRAIDVMPFENGEDVHGGGENALRGIEVSVRFSSNCHCIQK